MNGFQIKLLAFIFMIFDHLGYLFPESLPIWFRLVGRFSFPAFGFLIAEGCKKTRSPEKYMLRLGLLALACEIPYDLCFNESINFLEDMNIIWTLLAGAAVIYVFNLNIKPIFRAAAIGCILAALGFLGLDYGVWGVVLIFAYYVFKGKGAVIFSTVIIFTLKWLGYIAPLSFYSFFWAFSCLGWVLPVLYNGERGEEPKYFFYAAYFLHIILLLCLKVIV